jgi:hypothetical protein
VLARATRPSTRPQVSDAEYRAAWQRLLANDGVWGSARTSMASWSESRTIFSTTGTWNTRGLLSCKTCSSIRACAGRGAARALIEA